MHRSPSLPFALLLTLPLVACVNRGDSDGQDVSSSLEKTNGGFDTADEAPAFDADDELAAAAIEADASAPDALAANPATVEMGRASAARGYEVVLLWGKLPADRGAETGRDWTGALKLSRGGLVVRRTIAFEDATDHLLPRTTLDTVSFQSMTRGFADGLVLSVLDPNPAASTDPQILGYTPADGSTAYRLDLSQLAAGPIVIDAGDGYKIVAIGHRRHADPCDRGVMRGRWHALSSHLGTYLGVVTNEAGERVGHVRGVFGQRRNGDAVLFGKFIDREGGFRGMLVGSYANGQYRARWMDRQGDHGSAHGAYFEGATASSGHFLGRWAEASCSDDN